MIEKYGFHASMSKKGDCYNNAPNQMAEDFYKLPA